MLRFLPFGDDGGGAGCTDQLMRWAAVGAVGLVVLVVGVGLGWQLAPDTARAPPASDSGGEGGAAVEGPGPERAEAGIGVGFAPSRAGAVAAAETYKRVLLEELGTGEGSRWQDMIRTVAVEPEAMIERLGRGLEDVRAQQDADYDYRVVPVAWRMESYTEQRATVAVWTVSLTPGAEQGLGVGGLVQLRWTDDDWKLVSMEGEAPPYRPLRPGDAEGLDDYRRFEYRPGAVS